MISRRSMLAAGLGAGLLPAACAAEEAPDRFEALLVDPGREPDETFPLWPDGVPGGVPAGFTAELEERNDEGALRDRAWHGVAEPYIAVFRAAEPDGSALIIAPGGGYSYVVMDKEGYEGARWFSRHGITVFVLFYRLPGDGWQGGRETSLQDAQRAVRLVRARAGQYGIDTGKLGFMGYSAGGHVAGSIATRFAEKVYDPVDDADRQSARPDVAALCYPVATMADPFTHAWSRKRRLGDEPTPADIAAYSIEQIIPADGPPLFLMHAADDEAVPVENSLQVFDGARRAGVPADLHVFPTGGHGFGFRVPLSETASDWPGLYVGFARRHFAGR